VIGRQSAGGRIIASLKLKALKATGAVRCAKDLVEEALFERRRDLFSEVESVFFDTASLYFEGHHCGESIDRLGHTKASVRATHGRWHRRSRRVLVSGQPSAGSELGDAIDREVSQARQGRAKIVANRDF